MFRSLVGSLAGGLLVIGLSQACAAPGVNAVEARLTTDRLGHIDPGRYLAGDRIGFVLETDGAHYLLQFDDSPEVFVLHAHSASLGGRVLQYDSGETALQVSGWGGVTLYTDSDPSGLPAMRTGDSISPVPVAATVADVQSAAQQDAQHWAFGQGLSLTFSADWNALSQDPSACAIALQAMNNVARGLDRFGASAAAHRTLLRRIGLISVEMAGRPTVALNGKALVVTFDPSRGYEGRASSRAIAHALRAILSVSQKQS